MKHRLFIAIDIPADITSLVVQLENRLAGLNLPIIWEKPEKLHITLNFLGKVAEDRQSYVMDALRGAVKTVAPFTLTPAFLETMYKKHAQSFVYLGLAGDMDILKGLQKQLALSLVNLEMSQPERYLPHMAIGRLKKTDPVMTKKILDRIRERDFDPLPEFTVDHLTLYESYLSRSGSTYQKVKQFTF